MPDIAVAQSTDGVAELPRHYKPFGPRGPLLDQDRILWLIVILVCLPDYSLLLP